MEIFGLKAPLPRMSAEQREQKQRFDRHQKMADRHQRRTDDDHTALPEQPVGQQPAEDRREIDQGRIDAVDLRRQRLHFERTKHRLQHALETGKPDDVAGLRRQQHVFRHVEDEQRPHPVIGEALPHFGGEENASPRGWPKSSRPEAMRSDWAG